MRLAEVKFTSWDKPVKCNPGDSELNEGDFIVLKTESGTEIGKVTEIRELKDDDMAKEEEIKPILRKATSSDLEKLKQRNSQKEEALSVCQELIDKNNLDMKLVDVHFSFDGGRVTFAFTAEGRVDFRKLVRDLTRHFQKSIRLHQIGIRDEAKVVGDIGPCGRRICCRSFLRNLASITSDMAELQQVSHRGSDRISGQCGRLMCCLKYEQDFYEQNAKKLPAIGSVIQTEKGKGEVMGVNILKNSAKVKLDNDNILEVAL